MSDNTQLLGEIIRLKAKLEWLEKGLDKFAGKANQAEMDIEMIVEVCGRQFNDLFDRLEAVEKKLFPGIRDGLRAVEKVVGPETNAGAKYDSRPRMKLEPKSKPKN